MHKRLWLYGLLIALIVGCTEASPGEPAPDESPADDLCDEAEARLGTLACVTGVDEESTWSSISVETGFLTEAAKYLVPATPDARLPTVFINANAYLLHFDFMVESFPDLFAAMSHGEYLSLLSDPAQREFFGGTIVRHGTPDGDAEFHFSVLDDPKEPGNALTRDDIEEVFTLLNEAFELAPLSWSPSGAAQQALAAGWTDAPFPIDSPLAADFVAYNPEVGYGTIRLITIEALDEQIATGQLGSQDIAVVDQAPFDIETVVSGIVTGTPQGELSHLNIRSAARGTPNCYIKDAHQTLAEWKDRLVRLEVTDSDYRIEEASLEDALAWWEQLKPDPVTVPTPDFTTTDLPSLLEVTTATADERQAALRRFGAKGANLATLYQRIEPSLTMPGLLIPVHYYDAFMHANSWTVELGATSETLSFAETIERYLEDPEFTSDAAVRYQRLEALREAMRDVEQLDPALLSLLEARIQERFDDPAQMLRFRSSSNAEDSLDFSGAGLYDSTSACLADELDADEDGPSVCDGEQPSERTLTQAVLKVWASLWSMRAFEERTWYGIDHSQVAMSILINLRTAGELANLVAFSGHPTAADDDRFLVNAQLGELSVVLPEAGTFVERTLLTLAGGLVTEILRLSESSEVEAGEVVLSDSQLETLGAELDSIATSYPVDAAPTEGDDIVLDTEWKVRADGSWLIKQVRPFAK